MMPYKRCLPLFFVGLTACTQPGSYTPVAELPWKSSNPHQSRHVVARGETLFSLAFRYDKDYRLLAAYNHLESPYVLHVGQIIYLQSPAKASLGLARPSFAARSVSLPPPTQQKPVVLSYQSPSHSAGNWQWPVQGHVVTHFLPQQGKKGIEIAANKGALVRASASGVVAYAGSGLAGYGNLIIIKHDGQFLTAYGNNSRNRVAEGQQVKVGQIIAEIGLVDRKFWGVHFEIRKAGQPVNPLTYLK